MEHMTQGYSPIHHRYENAITSFVSHAGIPDERYRIDRKWQGVIEFYHVERQGLSMPDERIDTPEWVPVPNEVYDFPGNERTPATSYCAYRLGRRAEELNLTDRQGGQHG